MVINNIHDFAHYLGTGIDRIKHEIYKYTDCGAWIEWNTGGITVGTIVEGSDAEFSFELIYPFSSETYESEMEELEYNADAAWHEAND